NGKRLATDSREQAREEKLGGVGFLVVGAKKQPCGAEKKFEAVSKLNSAKGNLEEHLIKVGDALITVEAV
ncbi:hypothetical protein ACMD2_17673, partial [Ananas comosus]